MNSAFEHWISILLGIIAGGLTTWITSYVSERARQGAIVRSIGKITSIGESIKAELNQKTEEIKVQLSLFSQHKLSLKAAERDALLKYGDAMFDWYNSVWRCDVGKFSRDNFDVSKELSRLEEKAIQFDLAAGRLELFMHDQRFLDTRRDFAVGVIRFEILVRDALLKIRHTYTRLELELTGPATPQEKHDLTMKAMSEESEIVLAVQKQKTAEYEKIHLLHIPVVTLIHERLKTISTD